VAACRRGADPCPEIARIEGRTDVLAGGFFFADETSEPPARWRRHGRSRLKFKILPPGDFFCPGLVYNPHVPNTLKLRSRYARRKSRVSGCLFPLRNGTK
jgi:hypothetical protein